jgi:predicted acylesterase/phospholipase RssA
MAVADGQADSEPVDAERIGLAFSGGGHRATAFGLGALIYLADAGVHRSVSTVTSVSGGSLLNAFMALQPRPWNQCEPDEIRAAASRLATVLAGNPTWWRWTVRIGFALTALLLLVWVATGASIIFLTVLALAAAPCVFLGPRAGGCLLGDWLVWAFLALGVWTLFFAICWFAEREAIVQALTHAVGTADGARMVWIVAGIVWALAWGALIMHRHIVAGIAFGHVLARMSGRHARPDAPLEHMQSDGIRHILCATELHAGQHAYFSHDFVYSRGFGIGGPGRLPIRTAVQASANFPGGFAPRILNASRFRFDLPDLSELRWKHDFVLGPDASGIRSRWMVLSDGGVFDNTADAWYRDAADRHDRLDVAFDSVLRMELAEWTKRKKQTLGLDDLGISKRYDMPAYHPEFRDPFDRRHKETIDQLGAFEKVPDRVVVINAGRPEPWQSLWLSWVPFIGEGVGLLKISTSMYNNGTSARLRDLRSRFFESASRGAVVDIEEDPISRASEAAQRSFEGWPRDQVERSDAAWRYMRDNLDWNEHAPDETLLLNVAKLNTGVATTLAPLGADVTARLMYHGYLQTMVTLHVQFGTPLINPRPRLEDFVDIIGSRPPGEGRAAAPGSQAIVRKSDTVTMQEGTSMQARKKSVYRDPRSYAFLIAQFVILTAVGWIGLRIGPGGGLSRSRGFLLILALMTAFAVVAGRGITGYWRGILIDDRFKMSLSRLQLLAWTLVILSAIVTAGLTNAAYGAASPLSIQIPPELWVLLGISTASAIASPAALSQKRTKKPDRKELEKTVAELRKDDEVNVDENLSSVVLRNESPADARWGDTLKGDESGNAATVDLGKLQMFLFTFVLVLGYFIALAKLFDGVGAITALPAVDSSVNTLLGISHTGYLANKIVPHSREGGA